MKASVCAYTVTPDSGFIIDQHPRLAKRCGGQGLLQQQIDVADGVGFELAGVLFRQRVDVKAVHDALDLGLHPAHPGASAQPL